MKLTKEPYLYPFALLAGVASEFVGFEIEQWMIISGVPVNIGFPLSLVIFLVFPYLTTGVITYRFTGDFLMAMILATMVIPTTLTLINYLGI